MAIQSRRGRMATKQHKRSRLKYLLLPVVATAFLGYFGYHAFNGYYGIWAKARIEAESASLSAELASLVEQRKLLEGRVRLMRPESLDPDLVDEQARAALNMLDPRDVVILTPGR